MHRCCGLNCNNGGVVWSKWRVFLRHEILLFFFNGLRQSRPSLARLEAYIDVETGRSGRIEQGN